MLLGKTSGGEISFALLAALRFPVGQSLPAEFRACFGGMDAGRKRIAGACRRPYQGRTFRKYGRGTGRLRAGSGVSGDGWAFGFNDFSGLPRWRQSRISRIQTVPIAPDSTPVSHANLAAPGKACDVGCQRAGVRGCRPRHPRASAPKKGKNFGPAKRGAAVVCCRSTASASDGFREIETGKQAASPRELRGATKAPCGSRDQARLREFGRNSVFVAGNCRTETLFRFSNRISNV
jgi:hypothetical protein